MTWRLPGSSENGLYVVTPKKGSWFLDKGRLHPVLRITRRQIPLAPAFAMTAHASQGHTFSRGCIVDLRIGRGTSPVSSYVAMTRVKRQQYLLIYRPFERELFIKGPRRGPSLWLAQLRGETIDWVAIEQEFAPHARCHGCGFVRFKQMFAPQQWTRKTQQPHCKECVQKYKDRGCPLQCNTCLLWKAEEGFKSGDLHPNCLNSRVCVDCIEKRECRQCGLVLEQSEFTASAWQRAFRKSDKQGKCTRCARQLKGQWKCVECQNSFEKINFSIWLEPRKNKKKTHFNTRCNTCQQGQNAKRVAMARRSKTEIQPCTGEAHT